MADIVAALTQFPLFFILLSAVLGLIVGSFLNVVIYRLPVMMERGWQAEYQAYFHPEQTEQDQQKPFNLVVPNSTCPKCQHAIRWYENIPIISWLLLRGQCSNCQTPISARYPLVEGFTGLLSAYVAWQFGFGATGLMALLFVWLLVAMTFIDLDKMLLPDQLTLPLLWLGLLFSLTGELTTPEDAILGAVFGYGSLWSLYWGFKLLTGKEGMGYGDFKLLAALGAWMGWQLLPLIILLSSFVGALVGIVIISLQSKDRSQPIPFGPYLAAAGFIALAHGEWLVDQYWRYLLG